MRLFLFFTFISLFLLLSGCDPEAELDSRALYFEDLTLSTRYYVGDTFTTDGVEVTVLPFQWSNGIWTDSGYAEVINIGLAGGSGQEIVINNVNLGFNLGEIDSMNIMFGEYGGNVNIKVNDDFQNQLDFFGLTIPDINVDVTDLGSNLGTIALEGTMKAYSFYEDATEGHYTFVIGGQELYIDDLIAFAY